MSALLREALAGRLYEAHRCAEGRSGSTPWAEVAAFYSTTRDEWLAVADAALAAQQRAETPPMDAEDWAELYRLREEVKGPDGYATWKDAAVAERILRVRAETPQGTEATAQAPAPKASPEPQRFAITLEELTEFNNWREARAQAKGASPGAAP
jgi:hypothetical protein